MIFSTGDKPESNKQLNKLYALFDRIISKVVAIGEFPAYTFFVYVH